MTRLTRQRGLRPFFFFPQCQETLLQYSDFLGGNIDGESYNRMFPPVADLCEQYHLEPRAAFVFSRPAFAARVKVRHRREAPPARACSPEKAWGWWDNEQAGYVRRAADAEAAKTAAALAVATAVPEAATPAAAAATTAAAPEHPDAEPGEIRREAAAADASTAPATSAAPAAATASVPPLPSNPLQDELAAIAATVPRILPDALPSLRSVCLACVPGERWGGGHS